MKIIDQTRNTIRKQQGKIKKNQVPGSSKITEFRHQITKNSQQQEIIPDVGLVMDEVNFDFTSFLHQELETLMQPAESFGFNVNDFPPHEENQKWSDNIMETLSNESNVSDTPDTTYEQGSHQNEFRFVNHYFRSMCEFYSIKEPKWNFYSMVSNHYAYRYTPLRYSLIAWSGLHLSIRENSSTSLSKHYYKSALSMILKENFHNSSIPIELLLATAYFLALYDHMEGSGNTVYILRHVWSTLKIGNVFDPDFNQSDNRKLSAFAYKIITWLIYIDVKSALFMGNISFPDYIFLDNSKEENSNIRYLTVSEIYESKTVSNIYQHSKHILSDIYGEAYPKEIVMTDDTQDKVLALMVKNMLLLGSLIRLRCWLDSCGNSTDFDPESLEARIKSLHSETKKLYNEKDEEGAGVFHVLIVNALSHSSIIYFDRICHPDVRTTETSQKSADEILKIALKLKKLRGIETPGSLQWPLPMFIAGIETTNDIQKDWILHELEAYEIEGWGLHIGKMKVLLQNTWKEQDKVNSRVDVGKLMQDITGYFVM